MPTIITCAVNGASDTHPRYPAELGFPITPEAIARAAVEAADAGAAIVHVHARDPVTGRNSTDPAIFGEITERIRASGRDLILNLTCGNGGEFFPDPEDEARAGPGSDVQSADMRMRHIALCRPDIASLDVCTANQTDGGRDMVYLNTPRTLRLMAAEMRGLGVKPEIEVFNPGDLLLARNMIEEGLFDAPPMIQFVLGVRWCAPATAETVLYLRGLLPEEAVWTAMGLGAQQPVMAGLSALLGGNVRVGLEDNLYLRRGEWATNATLVARAARMVEGLGGTVATPGEARAILALAR